MKHFRIYFLLPLLLLLLATCKNADSPTGIDANGNTVTTIAGMINDENGQPIEGVAVNANGKTTITNKYGTFMIQNATVHASRCFIICKKNGYFTGSRAETPKGGGITELRLTLQSNAASYTLDATSGGKISVGSASVTFPSASLVTSNGTPYTGTAKIAARFLDPTQNSFYNSFSGDFTGKRLDGSQTELLSYGVLRVQITDASGNELKLATGKTATLTYPIATSMQKNAPASMPLWYFDETIGIWKEEVTAIKNGDFYTGEVSHFTDWNCDYPTQTGIIKGRVVCNNESVEGIIVTVGQRKVTTDTNGNFSCRVPSNTDFTISIDEFENFGISVTPLSVAALSNQEERNVTMNLITCPTKIKGTLVDCNQNQIPGTIIISYPKGTIYHTTKTGNFKINVMNGVPLSVIAVSIEGKIALPFSLESLNSAETKNIGQLIICENGSDVKFIDINSGDFPSSDFVFSDDGSMIAVNSHNSASNNFPKLDYTTVYNVKNGMKLCELSQKGSDGYYYTVNARNFSSDGTKLLLHWSSDSAYVINPQTGNVINKFNNANQSSLLPDGSAIITVKNKKDSTYIIQMYSVTDGAKIKDFTFTYKGVWKLAGINRNNQFIMKNTSEVNKTRIMYWDITTDSKLSDVTIPNSYFYNETVFSPDFSIVALASTIESPGINFYNTRTGVKLNNQIFMYPGDGKHNSGCIAISNDLTFVAFGYPMSGHKSVPPITFSLPDCKVQKILPIPPLKQLFYCEVFKYSANSQYLASLTTGMDTRSDFNMRIWNLK